MGSFTILNYREETDSCSLRTIQNVSTKYNENGRTLDRSRRKWSDSGASGNVRSRSVSVLLTPHSCIGTFIVRFQYGCRGIEQAPHVSFRSIELTRTVPLFLGGIILLISHPRNLVVLDSGEYSWTSQSLRSTSELILWGRLKDITGKPWQGLLLCLFLELGTVPYAMLG